MAHYVREAVSQTKLSNTSTETMNTIEELDNLANILARKIDKELNKIQEGDPKGSLSKVQAMRAALEDLTDKKAQLALRCYDLVDRHIHLLDEQMKVLETAIKIHGRDIIIEDPISSSNAAGAGSSRGTGRPGRKKSQGGEYDGLNGPPSGPIDPSEPVYCICRQTAYGNMIACDNDSCPVEWFHYGCVNLTKKPKNEWLCPTCSQKNRKK